MQRTVLTICTLFIVALFTMGNSGCTDDRVSNNQSAFDEQAQTENNQQLLYKNQPPPKLTWSMERDNLIKRFRLMNDRAVFFYMYVFIEGVADPIGYYQLNKVSSVNSQLTNTEQVVRVPGPGYLTLPSPAEDGSYGTNGDAVFGFDPSDIYIQTNMHYICSTVPLNFAKPAIRLSTINIDTEKKLKELMDRINKPN